LIVKSIVWSGHSCRAAFDFDLDFDFDSDREGHGFSHAEKNR
jgi:hypothetical protein